jgi:hypothetical protein
MRRSCFILFILFTICNDVQAQSEKAKICLLRAIGHDLDQFVPYYTYMDQVLLCRVKEGKYSVHEVEPGEHKIHTQYKGKIKSTPETELVLNLESGKTYYISVNIATKAFGKGRFYCEQLTEEEGLKRKKTCLLDDKCL